MDKNETKKNLKTLDVQLKNMFEIIMSKMDDNEVTEAMLSRKPLGGWSCASCQKNIVNMSGQLAEY